MLCDDYDLAATIRKGSPTGPRYLVLQVCEGYDLPNRFFTYEVGTAGPFENGHVTTIPNNDQCFLLVLVRFEQHFS